MTYAIAFPNDTDGVSLCFPNYRYQNDGEDEQSFLDRIAHKAVPSGRPFRFIPVSDIPADRSERDLWTADFSNPDGIAGHQ